MAFIDKEDSRSRPSTVEELMVKGANLISIGLRNLKPIEATLCEHAGHAKSLILSGSEPGSSMM